MNDFSIHDATRKGDLCRVRQLIEAGVSVDSLDEEGDTPLNLAVRNGQYEVAATPLNLAVRNGQYEVAALRINSKCHLEIKDRLFDTSMRWAGVLKKKDIVDLLLHRGAQVNYVDVLGRTHLHHASSNGWTDIVRLILANREADLNAVDQLGRTPLMLALMKCNEEVAAVLIQAGADVNVSDNCKNTALHSAAQRGNTSMVHMLLEKEELDLSPQDDDGNTPLHFACQDFYGRESIKQLLDAGADTNVKNYKGETALSVGLRGFGHKEIRLFVQKGAYLEKRDYKRISRNSFLKENLLKDVEFCTQSVVNKFNSQSLTALKSITYFARRLPNVDNFKLRARQIDEVENLVKCKIERSTFCNVVKVRPISLSARCVLSLITCRSGKKRAASPDLGHSSFKKFHS